MRCGSPIDEEPDDFAHALGARPITAIVTVKKARLKRRGHTGRRE
jgi:hypothetical protein